MLTDTETISRAPSYEAGLDVVLESPRRLPETSLAGGMGPLEDQADTHRTFMSEHRDE